MSKVLLIHKSDDPGCQMLLNIFERIGSQPICVDTVGDAGKYIADGDIFAVFVDLDIVSEISALEALIKMAKPYAIVVLLGSDRQFQLISQAFDIGADDYLRKPFNEKIFEAKTRALFARFNNICNINEGNVESLLDTMPSIMAITDGNGKILYANVTMRSKFNFDKKDIGANMICEVIACENFYKEGGVCVGNCEFCKFYDYEREVISTGRSIMRKTYTYSQLRGDRTHSKTLRFSMAPIEYGNHKSVIINMEDITFERNAINELTSTICTLRESRDNSQVQEKVSRELAGYLQKINDSLQSEKMKLKLLFNNMSSGFILIEQKDENLYFREGNAKINEIVKKDLSKYYGTRLRESTSLYTCDFYNTLRNVIATGRSVHLTTTSPDKSQVYSVSMYMPEPNFVAALVNDITEETKSHREKKERARQLRRLNIMLDDRNSELQKAIETKNKFISIIAHDLRNPLNAINGLSELLTRRLNPEHDQRSLDMAKILHQSAKGAYELLDNLLIWARTQQNTIQFNPEILNVHSVTTETLSEIKVQADRKRIMLINNTESNDTVWADKLMLQTIIRNIVSNAIKFTNEGGLIVVGSSQTADTTEITIEDNGVGMSQETIKKIVSSTELNSTKGTSGETGTGMGLIISKEFIQRHKGTLNVESTIGKGSTFIVTLPSDQKKIEENK
ncbi:MAG: hypothetical protein K6F33_05690 [Bacteroidales bacterium]|nr:hypothetical protein [Bacteroidales bacterium]